MTKNVRRLAPIAILACLLIGYLAFDLQRYLSFEALREHQIQLQQFVEQRPILSAAAFIVIYAVVVAASIPGAAVLSVLGGFLFGFVFGAFNNVAGATLGACLLFLVARTALGDSLHDRAGPWLGRMERGFRKNGVFYLLFLRLVPVFPFWLVNLVPAFLGMRLLPFALATFVGIIPGALVYTGAGVGLGSVIEEGQDPDLSIVLKPEIFLPMLGLGLLALVPAIYRQIRSTSREPTEAAD